MEEIGRRKFLTLSGAAAGLIPLAGVHAAVPRTTNAITVQAESEIRHYATLGRTGIRISDISFGSSRLRSGQEDLVHHALDRGVNYFDTAEGYTRGASERVLGNALQGVRDKVAIVSKTQAWDDDKTSIMRALEGSLRRLQTDYIDVFFNHAVNNLSRLQNPEWFEFAELAKRQGKIRFTGISGHAGRLTECLDYAIENDLCDVLLVAYNFGQDPEFYAGLIRSFDRIARHPDLPQILAKAKSKNMGVVAMKTLMGARLNDMRAYEENGHTFSQAAFRWTLSNANVDALIVSMTNTRDIDEYLAASGASDLAIGDLEILQRYAKLNDTTFCRQACNDCEGACPYDVPIADVLRTRMYAVDYQDLEFARNEYHELAVRADACLTCSGAPCRNACTYSLKIDQLCAATHRILA
jgi:predicted aldo/keto reductase-like oxidoreductase